MPRNELIQTRRGTAAAWASANPVLAAGEPGFVTDTADFKIGDGVTAWNSLKTAGNGTYQPVLAPTGSYVYTNGLVTQEPSGKTYSYNGDGTVHTEVFNGTTRTYSYNTDGSVAAVA